VPYLVLGKNARSGPLASITGRAGTTNQAAALVTRDAAYPDPGGSVPRVGFEPTALETEAVQRYLTASAERLRAVRGRTGSNARRVRELVESLDRARLFRDFAKDGFGGREYTPDLAVQIPVGVDALEGGLSGAIMMESGDDWDTHQNNARQSQLFDDAFDGLTQLVGELETRAMLDDTLVVVLSEMGRTPRLNAGLGKDHWPVTSALLIGAGVQGGRAYGASNAELNAESIDFATGRAAAGGKQLQTPNLLAGVLELLGLDPADAFPDVEPFRAFHA
jgi:hypothetical protein